MWLDFRNDWKPLITLDHRLSLEGDEQFKYLLIQNGPKHQNSSPYLINKITLVSTKHSVASCAIIRGSEIAMIILKQICSSYKSMYAYIHEHISQIPWSSSTEESSSKGDLLVKACETGMPENVSNERTPLLWTFVPNRWIGAMTENCRHWPVQHPTFRSLHSLVH